MSAVYTRADFEAKYIASYDAVVAYVSAHPADSVDAIATATGLPYEICFEVCRAAGFLILPSASGELHFTTHKP